jgi:hypothetical protein
MPWIKGRSGNPSGRPPGQGNLAKKIRAKFGEDLRRLVDMAEDMLEDPATPAAVKKGVIEMLMDRAVGKPMTQLELTATLAPAPPTEPAIDFSKLSVEELEDLERLMLKASTETHEVFALPAPEPEDAEVASDGIIDEQ